MSFAVRFVVNPLSNRGQNDTPIPSGFLIAAPKNAALNLFFSETLSFEPEGRAAAAAQQVRAAAEGFHGRLAVSFRRWPGRGSRSPALLNLVVMHLHGLAELGVAMMAGGRKPRAGMVAVMAMSGGGSLDFMALSTGSGLVSVVPGALRALLRRARRGVMDAVVVVVGRGRDGRKRTGEPHRGHQGKFQQTIEQASHARLPSTPRTGPLSAARMQLLQHHGDEAGQVLTD